MDWNTFTANSVARHLKRQRTFALFLRRTQKLAAIADPATGGNECLCGNWGNEESRRIWREGWPRWRAYANECDKRYEAEWKASRAFEAAKRAA
jgi:hypothetical protein